MKRAEKIYENIERIKNLFDYQRGNLISEQGIGKLLGASSIAQLTGVFGCLTQKFNNPAKYPFELKNNGDLVKINFTSSSGKPSHWSFGSGGWWGDDTGNQGKWACNKVPEPLGFKITSNDGDVYDSLTGNWQKPQTPTTTDAASAAGAAAGAAGTNNKTTTKTKQQYTIPNELKNPVGNKTGVQAFQDWLDTVDKNWVKKYGTLGSNPRKGYGKYGASTSAAWTKYGKTYLEKLKTGTTTVDTKTNVNQTTDNKNVEYGDVNDFKEYGDAGEFQNQ